MADYHIDAFRIEISKNLYTVLDGFSWQDNAGIDYQGLKKYRTTGPSVPENFLSFQKIF